jgi:hypothetical protein
MELDRTDTFAIAVVILTIVVSTLCYAFLLDAGIVIAE